MKWNLKEKAPESFVKKFPEYSPFIIQLLYDRGLKTQEQIDEFFNPDYVDFYDPFLLKGMKEAVKRIKKAISKKEKILIFGDYDADGVCSSAILYQAFKHLGVVPQIYIPDREKEGHGIKKEAIKSFQGIDLIITVDCGSRDIEEVKLAKSLGMDIIITDHHEVGDLPQTIVVDFHQEGDRYPFKHLAGAGVAFKLASALLGDDDFQKWLLDLTAIATVADVMPLIGENRIIVLYGLGVLAQTRWVGLKELMKVSRIEPTVSPSTDGEAPQTNLDTFALGFALGPRLNAASRMDHANTAFRLLITKDEKEAQELAQKLNEKNVERQKTTERIANELFKRLEGFDGKLIFEGSPDWSVGLVGLSATKVTEKFYRPSFIYREKNDFIQASGRSIPEFDLMEALEKCFHLFERYGGHKGAAGFTAKKENLEKIKKSLTDFAERKLAGQDLEKSLEIDAELEMEDISWLNYDQIRKFAPFGVGNPEPRFLIKNVQVVNSRLVGNGEKHLKLDLRLVKGGLARNIGAIGFNLGGVEIGEKVDIVFELIANEWNGHRDLQMKIIDLK